MRSRSFRNGCTNCDSSTGGNYLIFEEVERSSVVVLVECSHGDRNAGITIIMEGEIRSSGVKVDD